MAPGETTCDILKLNAPDPLATPEGRFAHSIKLPPPHDKPKEVHRAGMTSEEYFKALCDAEAGEFIFKTVENVEGIFQMRPRQRATDDMLEHLYALEDPYGYFGVGQDPKNYLVQPYLGRYSFVETITLPPPQVSGQHKQYIRYYRDPLATPGKWYQTAREGRFVRVPYLVASAEEDSKRSQYGFTWRGISRPHDRDFGISGGELIILDLRTNDVLAFRRGYARSGQIKNNLTGIWWMVAEKCPQTSTIIRGGQQEKPDSWFIYDVLKPRADINANIEEK
jgi:hypothetical protein